MYTDSDISLTDGESGYTSTDRATKSGDQSSVSSDITLSSEIEMPTAETEPIVTAETEAESASDDAAKASPITVPYKCRFCGLSYNYMTTLKAHERVHNVEEPFTCNTCGFTFRFNSELQAHNLEHSRETKNGSNYKCECGRVFVNYSDLLWHKHPGDEDEPEEAFKSLPPLRYRTPTVRKPYICQFCTRDFDNSHDLSHHLSSHRGERAFNLTIGAAGGSRYLRTAVEDLKLTYRP